MHASWHICTRLILHSRLPPLLPPPPPKRIWSLSLSWGLEEDRLLVASRQALGCPCPLHSRQWRLLQTSKPIDINFCIIQTERGMFLSLVIGCNFFFFLLFLTGYLIGIRIVPVLHQLVHGMARPAFFFSSYSFRWSVFIVMCVLI